MEVSQTLSLFFLCALTLVFQASAPLKNLRRYSLQSQGSVDILMAFAADTLQLCQVG